MMLPPGFEPGSSDVSGTGGNRRNRLDDCVLRESEMIGRTTLQEPAVKDKAGV